METCPSDDQLLDFAAGRLAGAEPETMLAHLDGCAGCRAALDAAIEEVASAAAATRDPARATPGSGPAAAAEPESGARISRYTILQRIGAGGMGVVYAAYDPELDRRVALKLLRDTGGPSQDEARARLTREARAMAKLAHPNVATVHDAGTHGGDVFVAMELVDGADLRRWLAERPRDWTETLGVLIAAGRGLAAAHRAGLVHRDVKPDNILVGRDGRIRVTDFGLARSAPAAELPEATSTSTPAPTPARPAPGDDAALTRQGAVVGTPAYLAPEQLRGLPAGPFTDQFSFCVTAFEALHGARPFGRDEREQMRRGIPAVPPPPPPGSSVPARVSGAVRRGLELDPARRFPSMDALLDELEGRRSRRRRRAAAVGIALGAMGAAGFAASVGMERLSACRQVPAELSGVWGEPQRQALEAAFERSGAPFAPAAWASARQALDGYASAWVELGVSACEAGRSDPSQDLPVLQRVCLKHRRSELRSLVEVLAAADAKVVDRSFEAVSALTPISRCADAAALRAPVDPPRDAPTREKVEALRDHLAKLKALHDAGRYPAALPGAQAAVADARALGYPPILAEALIRLGKLLVATGAARDAVPVYEEAELAAEEARDEHSAAEAAVDMVQAHYLLHRVPEGQQWQRRAEAYVRRLGREDDLRATLLNNSASLARQAGRLTEAVELFGQAAAARERQLGPDHPLVARTLRGQAIALEWLGQIDRAMQVAERALAIQMKAQGPDHPSTLGARYVKGLLLSDLGKSAEAVQVLRPVLEAQIAQLGAENPQAGDTARALALALGGVREFEEAHRSYALARAAAAREKGEVSSKVAQILGDESNLLNEEKRHADALALAGRALDMFDQAKLPEGDDRRVFSIMVQGDALKAMGRFSEAAERYRRSWTIREKALGPDSQLLTPTMLPLGEVYLSMREWSKARAVLEECVQRVATSPGPFPATAAQARFGLAQALWGGGGAGDRARATALAEEASRDEAALEARPELRGQISRWLAARR